MTLHSLPLFMARRYLFSKKKVGAVNVIAAISVAGVAFGTAALLCTLSVFNGFHDLISSLYTNFDPPLMVTPAKGKFLATNDPLIGRLKQWPGVEAASLTLTDNALFLFQGRPLVVTVKGVDNSFEHVTRLRTILYGKGQWRLEHAGVAYGTPGIGLAAQMGGIDYGTLEICAPRKGERVNLTNPIESFNADDITASGVCFDVNQSKYDASYLLVPLAFAQNLFEQPAMATALELSLKPGTDLQQVKRDMQQATQGKLIVRDQMEQQQDVYNVMLIEKLIAYLFLTFILIIACFNIIGSVSMLIIDKRDDAATLRNLGASERTIFRIFLYEGRLITLLGAVIGILTGLVLCWAQQTFGLITMGGSQGNFIIDAYPVSIHPTDVILVLATVIAVGFASVWWPVKYLSRKFLNK